MLTEDQIVGRYKQLRGELGAISQKINELEADANEHALVLKALDPIAANRKCFRLIGGVLVEQNVGLVKPSVQNKSENLKKAIQQLTSTYEAKSKETLAFQKQYKIRVQGEPEPPEQKAAEGGQQGVLVGESS